MKIKKFTILILLLASLTANTLTLHANEDNADSTNKADKLPTDKKDNKDENSALDYEEKLELIIPSQESLFDFSKRLDIDGDGFLDEDEKIRLADGDLEQGLLPRVVQILITFSGTAFFIFFTFAGVRLLLSRGNEEDLTKTKDLIVQGVIGSVLIVGSFGIIIGIIRLFDSLR